MHRSGEGGCLSAKVVTPDLKTERKGAGEGKYSRWNGKRKHTHTRDSVIVFFVEFARNAILLPTAVPYSCDTSTLYIPVTRL